MPMPRRRRVIPRVPRQHPGLQHAPSARPTAGPASAAGVAVVVAATRAVPTRSPFPPLARAPAPARVLARVPVLAPARVPAAVVVPRSRPSGPALLLPPLEAEVEPAGAERMSSGAAVAAPLALQPAAPAASPSPRPRYLLPR